jgi:N-acetylmuramoyl-L-alanine amidase
LKADVKALAGTPASKKEQIHDGPADGKSDLTTEKASSSDTPKAAGITAKGKVSTVTKVVVEADDDDDEPPVKVAKLETPRARPMGKAASETSASGTSGKAASVSGGALSAAAKKSDAGDADAPGDDSAVREGSGKASSRLATKRRADLDIHEAQPTAGGDRSLIRALGLKIGKIVIDPGHGGHDTGTIGPNGLEEKDLVLEVGRRLGKLLETRLGAEVVYTRKDDTFIPLETRTAIANQQRADLFVSIHANSSEDSAARGVETYYLNFTSSPEALEVAARENAVSEKSIYELQDLVKKIALKEKIEESREFAGDVQESLHSGLAAKSPGIRDRGVKKAPFIVLIGANMPSILAEISFVSNPGDEHRLETSEYRQRIAESLYRGIAKYVNGLSGVKVASKMDKAAGQ